MKATAVIERDEDGIWIAELVEEPRCHTFGRTLAKAKQHIVEATSLWFEVDEDDVSLECRVVVGDDYADHAVGQALEARRDEHAAHERSVAATRDAVEVLVDKAGLSLRDAGELLDISFQRVHQLLGR